MIKLAGVLISIGLVGGLCFGSHYGVVMGVADYPGSANDLSYTDDDALAVYERLLGDGILWSPARLILLLDEQATKEGLLAAIAAFSGEAGPDDTLVIYFSGHGTRAVDMEPLDEADGYDEYLCTYGSTLSEFLSDDELAAVLAGTPFGRVIVIIDACFSGGELRAPGREVKSLWTGPGGDGFLADLLGPGLPPTDLDDLEGKQVVALAAADDSQYAWEYGPPLEHGLFTYYLLEALGGWADGLTSLDGAISGEEAFSYLLPRVLAVSEVDGLNQTPQLLDTGAGEPPLLWVASNCFSATEQLEAAGWYMVAFPGVPCESDDPGAQLSDDLYPVVLFRFDPGLGGYRMYPGDPWVRIRGGWGYWLRVYEPPVSLDTEAWLPGTPAVAELREGWNQIGNPFPFAVAVAGLEVRRGRQTASIQQAQLQGWVSAFLFGYDPEEGGYAMLSPEAGALQPGKGYWMRAYVDCELVIPAQLTPPPPPGGALSSLKFAVSGLELPPPPPRLPTPAMEVQVLPVPNPVRDVHTTTFRVLGKHPGQVQALRVEVYDLAGRLVYVGEVLGGELVWHTEDLAGLPLANGVYLYKAYVEVGAGWIPAGVGKLVVLR